MTCAPDVLSFGIPKPTEAQDKEPWCLKLFESIVWNLQALMRPKQYGIRSLRSHRDQRAARFVTFLFLSNLLHDIPLGQRLHEPALIPFNMSITH